MGGIKTLSRWTDHIIALIALFIAVMSWFSITPTDIGKAMQKIAPPTEPFGMIVMPTGIVVILIGIVVIGVRTIQEFKRGNIPWGRLVSLAISSVSFLWSLTIFLSLLSR